MHIGSNVKKTFIITHRLIEIEVKKENLGVIGWNIFAGAKISMVVANCLIYYLSMAEITGHAAHGVNIYLSINGRFNFL